MLDDLFELSRIENGSFDLRREVLDLLDPVSDAREVAAQRGIRIQQRGIEGSTHFGDVGPLTRAVSTLLAHGIRHAPNGSKIQISATTRDDGKLVSGILENGIGVLTENLRRMFEVGWIGDAASTTESGYGVPSGAGLELAIARGIVQAHGGDVNVRSVDGGFCLDIILSFHESGPSAS